MFRQKTVAVVIPAYNEGAFIRKTLSGLPAFLDHIVVVDDGSGDGTLEEARAVSDKRLAILRHEKRSGVGKAFSTGFSWVLRRDIDIVITMDADGQMASGDIERLLEPIINDEADYVKGNRFHDQKAVIKMPKFRYLGNRFFTGLQRWSLGKPLVMDSQSGFTAIRCALLRRVPLDSLWKHFGVHNDLLEKMHRIGARIQNVSIETIYHKKRSHLKWVDALKILWLLCNQRVRARFSS